MNKYKVEITEILQRTVEIEAEDESDAINIVHTRYKNEVIVLDWEDFSDKEINLIDA